MKEAQSTDAIWEKVAHWPRVFAIRRLPANEWTLLECYMDVHLCRVLLD